MDSTPEPSPIGLLVFPGSNCDTDCEVAFSKHFGIKLQRIWHDADVPKSIQGLVIPGGFSFGDYLRAGHLASQSRCMASLKHFVKKGGSILGICNGFQVLTESGLLPGTLLKNEKAKFICQDVTLKVETNGPSLFQRLYKSDQALRIPIAHGEGRYYDSPENITKLNDHGQVILRYTDNPNGSVGSIAGICSESGKILGLMPHPERAWNSILGSTDGISILESLLASAM